MKKEPGSNNIFNQSWKKISRLSKRTKGLLVCMMAAIVALSTVFMLVSPAITMTEDTKLTPMEAGTEGDAASLEEAQPTDDAGKTAVSDDAADASDSASFAYNNSMITFEEETKEISAYVEAEAETFPEGTTMQITPVTDQAKIDAVLQAAEDDAANRNTQNEETLQAQVVDITFLTADGEETEPAKPVRVTLASDIVAQADDTVIVHIPEDGDPEIVQQLDEKKMEELKIETAENEVVFEAEQFSEYAIVTAQSVSMNGLLGAGNKTSSMAASPSTVTVEKGSSAKWIPKVAPDLVGSVNTKNQWQIDSYQYGTASVSKLIYDSTGKQILRLQKTVIPTEVENEFKVYLNAEPVGIHDWVNIFLSSGIMIVNNNCEWENGFTFSPSDSCTEVAKKLGIHTNCSYLVAKSVDRSEKNCFKAMKEKSVTKIILKSSTGDIELNVNMHYWLQQESTDSFTIVYCPKNGTKTYKLSKISYNDGTLTFPVEAYKAMIEGSSEIFDNMINLTTPKSVYDVMGDDIEYLGVVDKYPTTGSVSESTDSSGNKAVTWTLGTSDITDYVAVDPDNKESDYYYVNAYQLVYKIRLKTESSTYTSGNVVPTNKSATLTHREYKKTSDSTDTYYQPTVHGKRYQIRVKKLDEQGNPQSGAKFKVTSLTGVNGTSTDTVLKYNSSKEYTTDTNGYFVVDAELVGLEEGTYIPTNGNKFSGQFKLTLQEITAPKGYTTIKSDKMTDLKVAVGNWTNRSSDTEYTSNGNLLVYTGSGGLQAVGNEEITGNIATDSSITLVDSPINIAIKKVDDTGTKLLGGASFKLVSTTTGLTYSQIATSSNSENDKGYAYFKNVPAGTYTLTEEKTPENYEKTFKTATVTVSETNGVVSVAISNVLDEDGKIISQSVPITQIANVTKDAETGGIIKEKYVIIQAKNTGSGVSITINKEGWDNTADTQITDKLAGAVFTIYESNGTTVAMDSEGIALENLTSDENGQIFSGTLVPGTYVLEETSAPAGYIKIASKFNIVVSSEGITTPVPSGRTSSPASAEGMTVTVKNYQGRALPSAGGSGTTPLMIGALALMALALIAGYSLRQQGRRYEE